jgi:hypothetical protein
MAKLEKMTDRRRYERPQLVSSEPFERLALSCNGHNGGTLRSNPAYAEDDKSNTAVCQNLLSS